jgi:cytoskeletal protein CcmA (bactofilin family)
MVSVNGGLNGQVHADRIHVLAKANLSGTVFCRHFGSNPEATLAVKVECDPNMQGDKDRPANTSETIPRISGPLPLVDEMAFTLPEPVRVAV